MYDGWKILLGLIIFLALVTFPFYTNIGKPIPEPPESLGTPEVHTDVNMRAEHMKILNDWRNEVIREGKRVVVLGDVEVEKSLQKGCLDCHTSNQEFCQACHTYVGVKLYCWDCHLEGDKK